MPEEEGDIVREARSGFIEELFADPVRMKLLDRFVGDLLGPSEQKILLARAKGFSKLFNKIDNRCLEWESSLDGDGRSDESDLLTDLRIGLEHYLWKI